jgi:putative holliday junction resolvase
MPVWSNAYVETTGRMLGIDYGSRNIGLAFSDEFGLTVQPLPSIPNRGMNYFLEHLKTIVQEMTIQALVIGMPVNMDGSRGDSSLRMESVIRFLNRRVTIPVFQMDERLSTVEALEYWRNMTIRQQKRYRTVDSLAAALILERHLKEK